MRILLVALVVTLAGCASPRPLFTVEMNGRQLEFEQLQQGKVPADVEVTHFDHEKIRVTGEIPIEVNGVSVLAKGEDLVIGDQVMTLHRDARVLVSDSGEIQIRVSVNQPAPPVGPTLEVQEASGDKKQ